MMLACCLQGEEFLEARLSALDCCACTHLCSSMMRLLSRRLALNAGATSIGSLSSMHGRQCFTQLRCGHMLG